MKLSKLTKDELELMSYKDITYYIIEEKGAMNTSDLFKQIIKLLELPDSAFESKIGDYYTSLTTDKRFIVLEDGCWDLRNHHTSDKIIKVTEDDEEEIEDIKEDTIVQEEIEEDNYSSQDEDEDDYDDSDDEDLKDLVVVDEDELELEE